MKKIYNTAVSSTSLCGKNFIRSTTRCTVSELLKSKNIWIFSSFGQHFGTRSLTHKSSARGEKHRSHSFLPGLDKARVNRVRRGVLLHDSSLAIEHLILSLSLLLLLVSSKTSLSSFLFFGCCVRSCSSFPVFAHFLRSLSDVKIKLQKKNAVQ